MNPDGYYDHAAEVAYEESLVKKGEDRARRNLAAMLTNLRASCADGREDYLAALDDVAKSSRIKIVIKIVTEVRYTA